MLNQVKSKRAARHGGPWSPEAMPMFYLGIDVAKAKLDCALRLGNE